MRGQLQAQDPRRNGCPTTSTRKSPRLPAGAAALASRVGMPRALVPWMTLRTLVVLGICIGHVLACSSSRSASGTKATHAQKYAPGSPELRTVDNAGFVDPGGRTHEVSAGVYGNPPTEYREAVPPPQREEPSKAKSKSESGSEAPTPSAPAAPASPASPASDPSEFTGRAARALCDRESYCGRVGAGKAFESAETCMAEKRERVHHAISEASCELRGDRISACLTAIRGAACGAPATPLQPPTDCTAPVLCRP